MITSPNCAPIYPPKSSLSIRLNFFGGDLYVFGFCADEKSAIAENRKRNVRKMVFLGLIIDVLITNCKNNHIITQGLKKRDMQ